MNQVKALSQQFALYLNVKPTSECDCRSTFFAKEREDKTTLCGLNICNDKSLYNCLNQYSSMAQETKRVVPFVKLAFPDLYGVGRTDKMESLFEKTPESC